MNSKPIGRREFIAEASLAGLAAAARTRGHGAVGPAAGPIPAIDAHVHFYDTRRPGGVAWPPRSEASIYHPHLPDDFARRTAPFHVLGEVVVEASPLFEDNQWVLDLARDNDGIVGYIGRLPAGTPDFERGLRRFGANPLFRGIRLAGASLPRIDEPGFRADLARLADRRLTLDVLGPGSALAHLVRLARREPKLRIVIEHLPYAEWDGRPAAMRAALADAAGCPNVYAKVSNVIRLAGGRNITDPAYYRPGLDVLWDLFGARRVFYASNWTASARTATYAEVYRTVADYASARGRADAEAFFWRNSIAVYDWVPRGASAAWLKDHPA